MSRTLTETCKETALEEAKQNAGSDIQQGMSGHAKKQENIVYNGRKPVSRTDLELTRVRISREGY